MKRINTTAIALATAGALSFAALPAAQAQDTTPETQQSANASSGATNSETTKAEQPATSDTATATANQNNPAPAAPQISKTVEGKTWNLYRDGNGAEFWLTTVDGKMVDVDGREHDASKLTAVTQATKTDKGDQAGQDITWYLYEDANGAQFWLTQKDGKWVDHQGATHDISTMTIAADLKGVEVTDEKDATSLLTTLGVLPAVLLIGGIAYKLVIDGQGNPVYMAPGKEAQVPTAEDKAASDKLVADNSKEVVRQAADAQKRVEGVGAAETTRGTNAATGNNEIAKGLIGLVIATILGAAVFAFGRRQLV